MRDKPVMPYSRANLGALLMLLNGKEGGSISRLALYIEAADSMEAAIAAGQSPAEAFMECFAPSRAMHTIAKRLGLRLNVERGHWVSDD